MKKITLYCFCVMGWMACQSNETNNLIGKWKTISLKNPAMDRAIAQELADIDTFGNADEIAKQAVNIDSFKQLRKKMLELDIAEQQKSILEIQYEFTKNGIGYISNTQSKDSALYNLKNGVLTIDAPALTGIGDVQILYVKSGTSTSMELQMIVGQDTSLMQLQKIQ
jgi:hypothetical protein